MEPRNELDQWLDHALGECGDIVPRSGLEARILANLATEAAQLNKWALGHWAFAAIASLAGFAAIWTWTGTQNHRTRPTNLAANATLQKGPTASVEPSSQVQALPAKERKVRQELIRAHEPRRAPRLGQFPSARGLTAQERLLARYAHEFPRQALEIAQTQAAAEEERISGELAAE